MPQARLCFFILTTGRRCNLPPSVWNLIAHVSLLARREHRVELAALSFCHSHCCCLQPSCFRAKHVTWKWTPGYFGGNVPLPLLHNPVSGIVKLSFDQNLVCLSSVLSLVRLVPFLSARVCHFSLTRFSWAAGQHTTIFYTQFSKDFITIYSFPYSLLWLNFSFLHII